jgi:UDP-glucuronate 4-epimerase
MQPGDVRRTFADVSKARRLLGYEPSTEFRDGIRLFLDWFEGGDS